MPVQAVSVHMEGAQGEAQVLPPMPLLSLGEAAMNPLRRLYRFFTGKSEVPITGPVGDAFRKEKKRMQMTISSPAADAMADMEHEERGAVTDIPHEQMLYRTSRGMLLTSSLIAKGIGAGSYMTAATELKDEEAEELLHTLELLLVRTPFEDQLVRTIKSELGSKWM